MTHRVQYPGSEHCSHQSTSNSPQMPSTMPMNCEKKRGIKEACDRHVITKDRDVLGSPTFPAELETALFIWRAHYYLPSPCIGWRTSDWNSIPTEE